MKILKNKEYENLIKCKENYIDQVTITKHLQDYSYHLLTKNYSLKLKIEKLERELIKYKGVKNEG